MKRAIFAILIATGLACGGASFGTTCERQSGYGIEEEFHDTPVVFVGCAVQVVRTCDNLVASGDLALCLESVDIVVFQPSEIIKGADRLPLNIDGEVHVRRSSLDPGGFWPDQRYLVFAQVGINGALFSEYCSSTEVLRAESKALQIVRAARDRAE